MSHWSSMSFLVYLPSSRLDPLGKFDEVVATSPFIKVRVLTNSDHVIFCYPSSKANDLRSLRGISNSGTLEAIVLGWCAFVSITGIAETWLDQDRRTRS